MSKQIKTVSTWLPIFTGYYESIFDRSDDVIESEVSLNELEYKEYYPELAKAGVTHEFFQENFWAYADFSECFNEASKALCDGILWLDSAGIVLDSEYEETVSPKYYNFSTDAIHCKLTFDAGKLDTYLKENLEAFTAYIKDRYTSRSGFISSYSNDVNDWLGVDSYGAHEVGSVLQFVVINEEGGDEYSAIDSLCDNSNCREAFYDFKFDDKGMIKAFKEQKKSA